MIVLAKPSGGSGGGSGDMTKAVYDTNNDGIVDEAAVITGQGALATLDEVTNAQIATGTIGTSNLSTAVTNSLALADTSVQPADIANFETTTELNARDTANRDRANHTGTQALSTISDAGTAAGLDVGTGANNVVQLDGTSKLPAVDGSQLTNLPAGSEVNDLTSAVTWANVPDANITQSSVTQHQGALSITESQISDLGSYQDSNSNLTAVSGVTFGAEGRVMSSDGLGGLSMTNASGLRTYLNVADGATANDTDANLKDRANHTGTQLASTISDFDTEVSNNTSVVANTAKLTCDTTNVTAAGALMDSEVTNLAQVKAFDSSDYATAAQGSLADSALQSSDIGSSIQAYDADLQAIAGLTPSAGDLLYHNGTNWVNLGVGTAGQSLQVNSGATAPEWGDSGGGGLEGLVSAKINANIFHPTATLSKLIFNSEISDIGNNYSSGTYTAPSDGDYQLHITITTTSSISGMDCRIYVQVNGSSAVEVFDEASGSKFSINTSNVVSLSAGDTVEFFIYHGKGSNLAVAGSSSSQRTAMSIYKLQ